MHCLAVLRCAVTASTHIDDDEGKAKARGHEPYEEEELSEVVNRDQHLRAQQSHTCINAGSHPPHTAWTIPAPALQRPCTTATQAGRHMGTALAT